MRAETVLPAGAMSGVRYSANVQPREQVSLAFKSGGYVREIRKVRGGDGRPRNIQQGDAVAKGTVLARVREADYVEKVNQAKGQLGEAAAALEKQRLDYARSRALFESKSLSKSDFDGATAAFEQAKSRVESAKAQLDAARIALDDCALTAPMDALVLARSVEEGSLVGSGSVGFTLADTTSVKVVFGVPDTVQDLKVGHILGGTPAKMQIGDFLGIAVASLALYFPLLVLHQGNINRGGIGFGDPQLSAPQAGLMASLAQGIVGHNMPWPLVLVGVLMGFAMIMLEVKSVMLFAVGMYLPLGTTFAIFVGGVIRWITDKLRDRRGFNDAQKARVDNSGVLTASGMIAGEALCGLVIAGLVGAGKDVALLKWTSPSYMAIAAMIILALVMVRVPLANAGRPEDPAPPTAIM